MIRPCHFDHDVRASGTLLCSNKPAMSAFMQRLFGEQASGRIPKPDSKSPSHGGKVTNGSGRVVSTAAVEKGLDQSAPAMDGGPDEAVDREPEPEEPTGHPFPVPERGQQEGHKTDREEAKFLRFCLLMIIVALIVSAICKRVFSSG